MDATIKQHLTLGREQYAAGDHQEAEPHLRAVIEVHDGFADVHNMLGVIYAGRSMHDRALRHFERAVALNPRYTDAALNLAVLYNELGRYDDAKDVTQAAVGGAEHATLERLDGYVRGKIANLHAELGHAYVAVGLLDRASGEYRKALDLSPTFVDIRTKLGTALADSGKLDEAIDELQAVTETAPDYVPGRTHLGLALWKAGRIDEARTQWESAIERDPNNRTCRLYLTMTKGDA